MKKIALSLAVLMTVGLAACSQKAAETVDSDSIKAAEEAAALVETNDSDTVADTTVVVAAEEVVAQ